MQYKTTVLTGYYGEDYKRLADVVKPSFENYCKRQGYHLAFESLPATTQYGFWKLEYIQWLLKYGDADLVFCTDIDVMITNESIPVESFVDNSNDFYITRDVNGINTGTLIIVNSDWSRKWVDMLLSHRHEFENEQTAIDYFRNGAEWKNKINILPHASINSYPYDPYYAPNWGVIGDRKIDKPSHVEGDWQSGDFLVHIPGLSIEKRLEILTKIQREKPIQI